MNDLKPAPSTARTPDTPVPNGMPLTPLPGTMSYFTSRPLLVRVLQHLIDGLIVLVAKLRAHVVHIHLLGLAELSLLEKFRLSLSIRARFPRVAPTPCHAVIVNLHRNGRALIRGKRTDRIGRHVVRLVTRQPLDVAVRPTPLDNRLLLHGGALHGSRRRLCRG